MGKSLGSLLTLAIAVFNPAALIGLSGFAATAFNFVLSSVVSSVFAPKAGAGGGSVADSGFLVNKQGNTKPIDIVYGNRRVAGTRIFIDTTNAAGEAGDDNSEYLHVAYAVAQGGTRSDGADSINRFTKILFNDTEAWNITDGIAAKYANLIDIRLWYGEADQTFGSPDVSALGADVAVANSIPSGFDGRGVAWAYITFKYDRDTFPGMPTVIFEVEGKKIKNVQTGAFTNDMAELRNPANVIYDYLTSTRYGKGLDPSLIDLASFQAARTYCASAGLTVDGAISGGTLFTNTEQLLASANCNLVFANGEYSLKPLKQESFSGAFEFNESNITGEWQISLGNKKNRYNSVVVNFFNPDLDWQPDSVNIENAIYLAEDSGVLNQTTIDLPFSSDADLAEKLATYYLASSRYQTVVNFKAVHTALQVEVGDPVYVDHRTPGWTGVNKKRMRVTALTLLPDGNVDVILSEYAPDSVYLENN